MSNAASPATFTISDITSLACFVLVTDFLIMSLSIKGVMFLTVPVRDKLFLSHVNSVFRGFS